MGEPDEDLWPLQDFAFRSGCGHMLPGAEWHPALLWRHEVRGQLHQYSLLTWLFDLWSTSSLLCALALRATGLGRAAYVTGVTNREREEQTLVHLPWFATVFLLAQLSLTVFEASGDRAVSQASLQGNGWVGSLLWSVVSPRQSYQLRLNLGSQLRRITLAAAPVCCCAAAPAARPLLWLSTVQRSIFTMDPSEAKGESCMGLSSPIQELFVNLKQDMPPLSVIHPRSTATLQETHSLQ